LYNRKYITDRLIGALFARNVEEQEVLASDDVGDTVAVVGHGSEAATSGDTAWVLAQVQLGRLTVRRLRGGQPPRFTQHLLHANTKSNFTDFHKSYYTDFTNTRCTLKIRVRG
jgi:hypothetical protein